MRIKPPSWDAIDAQALEMESGTEKGIILMVATICLGCTTSNGVKAAIVADSWTRLMLSSASAS